MPNDSKLTNPAGALGRTLDRIRLWRRRQEFAAKVGSVLRELGLNEAAFDERVQTQLAQICEACYQRDGEATNAHGLALEVFLRFTLEYPHLVERAMLAKSVFVASIGMIRRFHRMRFIPLEQTETAIERIKNHLIVQLREMGDVDDGDDERMRAELHIREL